MAELKEGRHGIKDQNRQKPHATYLHSDVKV